MDDKIHILLAITDSYTAYCAVNFQNWRID